MTNTDKTVNEQAVSYEILDDGYEIYLDGKIWIRQRGQYGKPIDTEKSYEENCLAQIEELTAETETPNNSYGISDDTYNQIIDDYTLSLVESGVL